MENINPGGLIAIMLIAIIINCLLLAWIVSAATQTKKRIQFDEVKIKLLMHIAGKLGVTNEEIDKILSDR